MIDSVAGAIARPMPTPIRTSTTATRIATRVRYEREHEQRRGDEDKTEGDDDLGAEQRHQLGARGAAIINDTAIGNSPTPDWSAV